VEYQDGSGEREGGRREDTTNSTDDCVMTREMSLAVLAAKYLVRVEIDVVGESHPRGLCTSGRLKAVELGMTLKVSPPSARR